MKKITCVFLLLTAMIAVAQKPVPAFQQKAMTLRRFLELNHYQPITWNDSASVLLYNKWLHGLDEEKLFFTQKELALLEPYKYRLDDELISASGGWNFFSLSLSLYKSRLQKTDSIIKAILAKPFDLSKPDNITWPFNEFASNEQEAMQRWQKYLKWQVLKDIADDITDDDKKLTDVLPSDIIKMESKAREKEKRLETSYIKNLLSTPPEFTASMEDSYLNAITWCYDPHTSYMNMKEKHEFDTKMSASAYSSGFDLEENDKGDLAVSYLQPGGSAWRSGQLHTGDVLVKVKVNGVEKKVEEVSEAELDNLLSSESEGDIEITVKTAAGEIKAIKLTREKIMDEESVVKSYVLHGSKNIGYINLPGFYSKETATKDLTYNGCANDVSKEIVKLKKDTIAGLILDLRFNGGGSMWEAMQLAGIFIDIGPVASTKERNGKVHFLKDPNRGTIYDGPLIVLINGGSASASEFVSAMLQDYNRALIVGGTSYGKGTAQIVLPMDTSANPGNKMYEDYVKVTEEKFYRVNGSTTQWKGVVPDIELPDMYSDDSFKEKANRSALQPDNSKVGIYQPLKAIPVQELKTKANERIASNNYFSAVTEFTKWYRQYNAGRTVPLQWAGYASQYSKTMDMFRLLKDEVAAPAGFSVSNNSFDSQRINISTSQSKAVNDTYLKQVKNDNYIHEGFKIMFDWIGK